MRSFLNFNNILFLPCLQDLTGLESMDQCRRTLEQHNWNIEVKQYSRVRSASLVCSALHCLLVPKNSVVMGSIQCLVFQAAVQDRLNEQEGVPSVFNPPPSRPLQVNTADHRVYSYIVSRPQPRVSVQDSLCSSCRVC